MLLVPAKMPPYGGEHGETFIIRGKSKADTPQTSHFFAINLGWGPHEVVDLSNRSRSEDYSSSSIAYRDFGASVCLAVRHRKLKVRLLYNT